MRNPHFFEVVVPHTQWMSSVDASFMMTRNTVEALSREVAHGDNRQNPERQSLWQKDEISEARKPQTPD